MKIGVAVDCGGIGHDQILDALAALEWYGVHPDAYAVPLGHYPLICSHLYHKPYKKISRFLLGRQIHRQPVSSVPVAVCARDLMNDRHRVLGIPPEGAPLLRLSFCREQYPFLVWDKRIYTGRHLRLSNLLLALNQLGCDKYIVLCSRLTAAKDRPRCLYWDIESSHKCWRDHTRIYDFLYFSE